MAGGYNAQPKDPIAALYAAIDELRQQIRDLATPSGTERNETVAKLEAAIVVLQEQAATLVEQQTQLTTQQGRLAEQQQELAETKQGLIYPRSAEGANTGFDLLTGYGEKARATVTVPAGTSQVQITGFGSVSVVSSVGGATPLLAYLEVNGEASQELAQTIPQGGQASITVPRARVIGGLTPGQQILIRVMARSLIAHSSNAQNRATVSVSALFLP